MDRMLTIADVFKPLSANEVFQARNAALDAQMAPLKMHNEFLQQRINELKIQDAQNEFNRKMDRQNLASGLVPQFTTPAIPAQPAQPAMTVQPQMTSATGNEFTPGFTNNAPINIPEQPARPAVPSSFDEQGYNAALMNKLRGTGDYEGATAIQDKMAAQKKAQADEALNTAKTINELRKTIGIDALRAAWPALSQANPVFAKIDPSKISEYDGKTILHPAMTPDGKEIPGAYLVYGDDGKMQVIKMPDTTTEKKTVKGFDKKGKAVVEDKSGNLAYQDGTPYKGGQLQPVTATDSGMQLTADALKALGEKFAQTGEIPGMGMGKAATEARTKVLNQWASDLNRTGTSVADQNARQAAYKASKNELSKLQGQRGVVIAFANTAEKNLGIVSDLSEKVDRTGSPVINRWILAGKRSVAGDPDVAKFDAAVRTAINEYAKVTSSATGGGVTSDAARKEVESMLNTAQTKEQVDQVITLLRTEMGNRKKGYDEQIDFIKKSIAGKGGSDSGSTSKPLPPNAKVVNGVTYYNVNGKWYQE